MRRMAWTLLVLVSLLAAGCAPVTMGNWVFLGERVVNDRAERDSIAIDGVTGELSALKIRVLRRPVHIIDMKVHFANGRVQDVSLRRVIPAGDESRVIDLVGSDRRVRRVEFRYEAESRGRGKRATIQLYGRR